ncbi:CDP-glycerol glycerophosphotransferase family protein, partial [Pseudomonas sp. AH2 (2023)]|uniref:CDP-glycerol glycerophosphotransferase family protein n=1 Tax=Pseudomonas sp. AH2 (2023) TaxID=3048599 RepID=UPI002B22CC57
PRTDSLLADDADEVRRATRRLLGLRDDQVAVLHATTWREDLSRGDNTSADPGLLDVKALAEELGHDVVVLQRSHHSVARSD